MTGAAFAALFDPPPTRWGLRGDTHLWQALREQLAGRPCPADAATMQAELAALFRDVVGHDWQGDAPIPVASLVKPWGGMSNGVVDPRWWRETGVPLLAARLAAGAA